MPCYQGNLLWAFSVEAHHLVIVVIIDRDKMAGSDLVNGSNFYRRLTVDGDFRLMASSSNHTITWNLCLGILCYFLLVR